jgi:uncharacterized phage protein (TIGR01671 family)
MNNRQFKFRVWNLEDKCWDNPALLEVWDDTGILKHLCDYQDEKTVVQQFTGLKDKNGKEIYEGDIYKEYYKLEGAAVSIPFDSRCVFNEARAYPNPSVEGSDYVLISEVYWDNDWHCYHARRKDSFTGEIQNSHRFPFKGDNIEIIGNIFENPELIK